MTKNAFIAAITTALGITAIATGKADIVIAAREVNGFFAYCTSNSDGTGNCINEEDQKEFTCVIVPGNIIACPSKSGREIECIWVSEVVANSQAQFWCDKENEMQMYGITDEAMADDGPDGETSNLEPALSPTITNEVLMQQPKEKSQNNDASIFEDPF